MDWEKASSELSDILAGAADSFPLVERRKMFGGAVTLPEREHVRRRAREEDRTAAVGGRSGGRSG